jgi:hypothetical protein
MLVCCDLSQAASVDNSVKPVSYFINHINQLKELNVKLNKYQKASLVAFSGAGKTQIARMHSYDDKDKYTLIWFFDCNLDLNQQFIRLAREINTHEGKEILNNDVYSIKQEVMSYLDHKKDWLLVFDNIKIGENKKVIDFIRWENNGHIIFCSQDNTSMPHVINNIKFNLKDSLVLTNTLLNDDKKQFAQYVSKKFLAYPALIALSCQVINNFDGLSLVEYEKLISQNNNEINTHIELANTQLSKGAKLLLQQISLINNRSFSRNFLKLMNPTKDVGSSVVELSKFMLIVCIDSNEDNPIYEMHDVFSDAIKSINSNSKNREILDKIIEKTLNSIPKSMLNSYLSLSSDNLQNNIEIIQQNAQKYGVQLYQLMKLNRSLLGHYISSYNFYNAEKMISWFLENEQNIYTVLMSNEEKEVYAEYLQCIGGYNRLALRNYYDATKHFTKSLKIIDQIQGDINIKFSLIYQIAQSCIATGKTNEAEEYIEQMESLLKQGVKDSEIGLLYLVRAKLFYYQGKYNLALIEIERDISESVNYGLKRNDLLFTSTYLMKLEILNALKKNKEALAQAHLLLSMHKNKPRNDIIFGSVYLQLAVTLLNQNKIKQSQEYADKALLILKNNEHNLNVTNLDLAHLYNLIGDLSRKENQANSSVQAIDYYMKALNIYNNIYGKNKKNILLVSDFYLKGAKFACSIHDNAYTIFSEFQINDFGLNHSNTQNMIKYCESRGIYQKQ